MDSENQIRLLEFLKEAFDIDGTIHFLALSAKELSAVEHTGTVNFKVRVAITFREGDSLNPYFDGTDLYVAVNATEIQFTNEEEWADGPPIMEGSPIEIALVWVSEFGTPFLVSPEALEAANRGISNAEKTNRNSPVNALDQSI